MTTSEFSAEFDILYNNITSNQAPGLNDYEKSVFLTKAQNALLEEYFNNKIDGTGGGFDGSHKRQIDFNNIIQTTVLTQNTSIVSFDPRSIVYNKPLNVLYIINEQLSLLNPLSPDYNPNNDILYTVIPISYDEYNRLTSKPYKYPPYHQAWRLLGERSYNSAVIEIIARFPEDITAPYYRMRYVRKPTPIILENLSQYNLTLEGVSAITECELPAETHQDILERAVTLAKIAWNGATMTQVALANQQRQ